MSEYISMLASAWRREARKNSVTLSPSLSQCWQSTPTRKQNCHTMTPPMIDIMNENAPVEVVTTNTHTRSYDIQKLTLTKQEASFETEQNNCIEKTGLMMEKPIIITQEQKEDFTKNTHDFRMSVRKEEYTSSTNGICPGKLQCNLVVLPKEYAFDFLLFCQRNPKSCPLIEVCTDTSIPDSRVAKNADLKTDIPKYAIYKNGALEKEVYNVKDYWPKDGVAFLLGCSFSFDYALQQAGVLPRTLLSSNVPMYKTNIACRPAGTFKGNLVVSMRLIPASLISKEVEITSNYPHAHGAPVCIGCPASIGILDLHKPDWGVPPPTLMAPDVVPVFHACGVTPQNVILESKIPFCITHSPGHMFLTDLAADQVFP